MYFPDDKMRVNRFKVVAIPRPCEYMRRFGATVAPSSMYSGEEFAPLPRNKVDMMVDAERYDAMMQEVDRQKEQNGQ